MKMRLENAGSTAFGHPVKLDQSPRPTFQHIGLDLSRKWRTGGKLHLKRRQIMGVKLWMRHQTTVLHRHKHRVGHPLARRNLQPFAGIKLRH